MSADKERSIVPVSSRELTTRSAELARRGLGLLQTNKDRDALEALYWSTDGPNWRNNSGWLKSSNLEDWYGVACRDGRRVSELDLRGNQLSGPVPAALGQLSELRGLWLVINRLAGPIPPELGQLSKLEWLGLLNNQLTGPIPPELGRLSKLSDLSLSRNQLTGPIPPWLGQLSELAILYLSENHLSGPIPPELGQLSELRYLDLYENQLSGPIPPSLGHLSNLKRLGLRENQLTGRLPRTLMNLGLSTFRFSGTRLCEPPDREFQQWLASIPELSRTGVLCREG